MTYMGRLEPFAIVSFRPGTAVHWDLAQWPLTDRKAVVRTALLRRQVLTRLGHQQLTARQAELLPTPYFHVVFTVPAPIADIAYQNKAEIYGIREGRTPSMQHRGQTDAGPEMPKILTITVQPCADLRPRVRCARATYRPQYCLTAPLEGYQAQRP